jgi:hypothetical protein
MVAGFALTVAGNSSDTDTGFKWGSGNISQSTANDVLIITGGGAGIGGALGPSAGSSGGGSTTSNNIWSGGTIGSTTTQSDVYINGGSALQITQNASALGDNIIIGQDNEGGSTLEFYNQRSTLQVNNNAGLQTASTSNDLATCNQILFDTDVTQSGMASKGLGTTSADSFIDNYGQIIRSNAGTYQTDLPIRNEPPQTGEDKGLLDLQSSLWISGSSANKTANYSLDQEGGTTLLENGSSLNVNKSTLIKGGYLQTYGAAQATIQTADNRNSPQALNFQAGTLDISADNHALYGSLKITGDMSWTGGTFECYVNGVQEQQQTQLAISGGLTTNAGAHLHMNVIGQLTSGFYWSPVTFGTLTGTLTFDSGNLFTIAYNASSITVTAN